MSITLTANYKETLDSEIVDLIDDLVENGHDLDDLLTTLDYFGEEYQEHLEQIIDLKEDSGADNSEIYDFVEKYSVEDLEYFEKYNELVNDYNQNAVDAYIDMCNGPHCVDSFEEAYEGEYDRVEDFVEQFLDNSGESIPSWVVVDYEATWNYSLRYDYSEQDGFYFRNV